MEIARTWRQQASNLRLIGCRCSSCEALIFPQRVCCPECGGGTLEDHRFSGLGRVIALTTVREAPQGFGDQVPYIAGLIELDEGPTVTAMLTDMGPEEACAGMRVSMVTRRIRTDGAEGPILYGYKFRPAAPDA